MARNRQFFSQQKQKEMSVKGTFSKGLENDKYIDIHNRREGIINRLSLQHYLGT